MAAACGRRAFCKSQVSSTLSMCSVLCGCSMGDLRGVGVSVRLQSCDIVARVKLGCFGMRSYIRVPLFSAALIY